MSEVALRIRQAFEQLAADTPLSATDRAVMHAFERLMHGQAQVTDGAVTVVNICAEAGVSRATYYRSPLAGRIAGILRAPETPSPPLDALRAEIAELKRAERRLRSQHAVQVRELAAANAAYANQIQALTLANAQLGEQNLALHEAVQHAVNVSRIGFLGQRQPPRVDLTDLKSQA